MRARKVKKLDPDGPVTASMRRVIVVRADELFGFIPAALDPACVEELHDMRIAAKRLRYLLELSVPLFGADVKKCAKVVKGLQDLLGEIHDCDELMPLVDNHVAGLRTEDAAAVLAAAAAGCGGPRPGARQGRPEPGRLPRARAAARARARPPRPAARPLRPGVGRARGTWLPRGADRRAGPVARSARRLGCACATRVFLSDGPGSEAVLDPSTEATEEQAASVAESDGHEPSAEPGRAAPAAGALPEPRAVLARLRRARRRAGLRRFRAAARAGQVPGHLAHEPRRVLHGARRRPARPGRRARRRGGRRRAQPGRRDRRDRAPRPGAPGAQRATCGTTT